MKRKAETGGEAKVDGEEEEEEEEDEDMTSGEIPYSREYKYGYL